MSEEKSSPVGIIVVVAVIAGVIGIMIGKSGSNTEPVVENQPPAVEKAKPTEEKPKPTEESVTIAGSSKLFYHEVVSAKQPNRGTCLRWNPAGEVIASGLNDGKVVLWNSNGELVKTIDAHTGSINSVEWNSSGEYLATASSDGTVKVWKISDGTKVSEFINHKSRVRSVSWAEDGARLVSAGEDGHVRNWTRESGEEVWAVKFEQKPSAVAWGSGKKRIAVITDGESLMFLDSSDGSIVKKIDEGSSGGREVRWSRDGNLVIVASRLGCSVWEVESGKRLSSVPGGDYGRVTFSKDAGHFIVANLGGHGGSMTIAETQTGELVQHRLASNLHHLGGGGRAAPTSIDWNSNPRGGQIAACFNDRKGYWLKIWTGRPIAKLDGHSAMVTSLNWSTDGKKIVTTAEDEALVVWDVTSGKSNTIRGHLGYVMDASWSNDGQIASGSRDKTVRGWDADTGKQLFLLEGHEGDVGGVCWSPDDDFIASASSDKTVRIWRVGGGEIGMLHTFKREDSNGYTRVAWSPNGKHVAGVSNSGMLDVWDPLSGEQITSIKASAGGISELKWHPDSTRVAIISNYMVRLYDISSGQLLRSIPAPHNHGAISAGLDWSQDGKQIFTVDGTVWPMIVEAESGNIVRKIAHGSQTWEKSGSINRVRFNPANQKQLAWCAGKTLWVMQLP